MAEDYLKDLLKKAKRASESPDKNSGFSQKKGPSRIPEAKPGEETLNGKNLEKKISAVRKGLREGLKKPPEQIKQPRAPEKTSPPKKKSREFSGKKPSKPPLEIPPAQEKKQPKKTPEIPPKTRKKTALEKSQPKFDLGQKRKEIEEKEPEIEMDFGEEESPKNEPRKPIREPSPNMPPAQSKSQIPPAQSGPSIPPAQAAEAAGEGKEISEVEEKISKTKEKILLDSYGEVKIYKVPGEEQLFYYVPVPRPTGSEKRIIRTIKEAATRLITISPFRIRDPEQRRAVYHQRIMDILESAPEIQIPKGKRKFYAEAVIREMVGYGVIDPLIKDDKLEEIMVIGSKSPVYVFHRDYEMMKTNIEFFSDDEIIDLINRIGREVGRRIDYSNPLLDARLADGSRVNATIEPASVSGPTLTIRKFREDPLSIIDLINFVTLTPEVAAFLWLVVEGMETKPANILIAGGTGSGKTTTLNVLASFIPTAERVITIEDTAELNLPLEHWIRFEARPPGMEHRGEITLDILTKNSLRMRPDRIIVGEIRHDEAFSLFTAMNTGHDGSLGTVHANSAQETIVRVTNPPMNVPETMLSGLNFVLVEHRLHDRKKGTIRRLTEISEVTGVLEGKAQVQSIFEWESASDVLKRTGVPSNYMRGLAKLSGMSNKQVEREIKKRQKFLENLAKQNIRSIEETSKRMKEFLLAESEK